MNNNSHFNPNFHHRKSIRLKGYDYTQAGLYFITICCNRQSHGNWISPSSTNNLHPSYFRNNKYSPFGYVENGQMILNEIGQIAYNEWMKTKEIRKNVELDEFIVMPDHIHGIIRILSSGELNSPIKHTNESNPPINNPNELNLNELLGECNPPINNPNELKLNELLGECNPPIDNPNNSNLSKILGECNPPINNPNELNLNELLGECNPPIDNPNELNLNELLGECNSPIDNPNNSNLSEIRGECNSPLRSPSQTIGAIIRGYKSSVTKQINNLGLQNIHDPIWQRNYYEHIIRNEKSFQQIKEYIKKNPAKWEMEKLR